MTSEQLRSPHLAGRPMSRETWLLRLMILEPARICDPQDLERWRAGRQAQSAEPKKAAKRK